MCHNSETKIHIQYIFHLGAINPQNPQHEAVLGFTEWNLTASHGLFPHFSGIGPYRSTSENESFGTSRRFE